MSRTALTATAIIVVFAGLETAVLAYQHDASPGVRHALSLFAFAINLLLCGGIVVGLGWAATGQWSGIALSSRNKYSLSKLQMAGWTIVVMASLATVVIVNLVGIAGAMPPLPCPPSPAVCTAVLHDRLDIDIPGPLLAALGIAAFTTAAAPSIVALKTTQTPTPEEQATGERRQAAMLGGVAGVDVVSNGRITANARPDRARLIDLVMGEELANAGTVDVSKVQQLIVTSLLLGAYIGLMVRLLMTFTSGIVQLPSIGDGFAQLLALSHAGYLVYKIVPKGAPAPDPAAAAPATGPYNPGPMPAPSQP